MGYGIVPATLTPIYAPYWLLGLRLIAAAVHEEGQLNFKNMIDVLLVVMASLNAIGAPVVAF